MTDADFDLDAFDALYAGLQIEPEEDLEVSYGTLLGPIVGAYPAMARRIRQLEAVADAAGGFRCYGCKWPAGMSPKHFDEMECPEPYGADHLRLMQALAALDGEPHD